MERLNRSIPLGALALMLFFTSGCKEDITGCMESQAPNFDSDATEECDGCCKKYIDYKVTGTADTLSIIYGNASGNKQQIEVQNEDWSKKLEIQVGDQVYLEARSEVSNGDVRVKIFENNDLYKEGYDNSNFASATVSGKVPNYD